MAASHDFRNSPWTAPSEAGYELLLALTEDDTTTEPEPPSDVEDDVASLVFWIRIYEFLDDMIEFRELIKQVGSTHNSDGTAILILHPLIDVACQMIEDRTKAFMKGKRKLCDMCPDNLKEQFEAHGVIEVIHAAFQQHAADLRSKTNLIDVKMQSALAQLGLDQFFAPTVLFFSTPAPLEMSHKQ
jgi:hypothetical protein